MVSKMNNIAKGSDKFYFKIEHDLCSLAKEPIMNCMYSYFVG